MNENVNSTPIPENPQTSPVDYTVGKPEVIFAIGILLCSVFLCNSIFYGGFHLGFALGTCGLICCSGWYLYRKGHRFGRYEKSLLFLSLVIAAGFARSADGFVKFVMILFLLTAVNLGLCLGAGQNRRSPDGASSLLDAPRTLFVLGAGRMDKAGRGILQGFRSGGTTARRFGATAVGLLLSLPIVLTMIFLLMRADAAFEGLVDLLPEMDLEEYLRSGFYGILLGWILFSQGLSLDRESKPTCAKRSFRGVDPLIVNTVLITTGLVYVVYLLSQLAYLSGGLSGILPEGYTMAQYARRGFFEMAWLCLINLSILCGVIWLTRSEGPLPLLTRIAGGFLGAVTVFLVLTASAKMFLYISSYGLSRLRVLTEVIMLWLAATTVLVTIRLFRPGFGYMKAVVLTAMVLGALVFWLDVDTVVARYNVTAYQSGRLETVDMKFLSQLGPGAVPYLIQLTEDTDPKVAEMAADILENRTFYTWDLRDWNWSEACAENLMKQYSK